VAPVKQPLYDDDDEEDDAYVPKPSVDEVVKNAVPQQVEDDEEEQIVPLKNPVP
jgi:hypothetical protein